MVFRLASAVMALCFVFATAAQTNDPDPIRWMVAYGVAAALSAAAALNRYYFWPAAIACAVYIIAALPLLPELWHASLASFSSWKMVSAADEEARETAGLLISGIWMAALCWAGRARPRSGR